MPKTVGLIVTFAHRKVNKNWHRQFTLFFNFRTQEIIDFSEIVKIRCVKTVNNRVKTVNNRVKTRSNTVKYGQIRQYWAQIRSNTAVLSPNTVKCAQIRSNVPKWAKYGQMCPNEPNTAQYSPVLPHYPITPCPTPTTWPTPYPHGTQPPPGTTRWSTSMHSTRSTAPDGRALFTRLLSFWRPGRKVTCPGSYLRVRLKVTKPDCVATGVWRNWLFSRVLTGFDCFYGFWRVLAQQSDKWVLRLGVRVYKVIGKHAKTVNSATTVKKRHCVNTELHLF